MPIYEYRCQGCGATFERFIRRAEDRQVSCPQCNGAAVDRIPSTFAVGSAERGDTPAASCCGLTAPCSDPKRCCER